MNDGSSKCVPSERRGSQFRVPKVLSACHSSPLCMARDGARARVFFTVVLGVALMAPTGISTSRVVGLTFRTNASDVQQTSSPATGPGYVTSTLCLDSNTLLNSNTVCPGAPFFFSPTEVVWDSANGDLYVTSLNSKGPDSLLAINGSTNLVVSNISVGSPSGVAYDSQNGDLYVTNWDSDSVSVISGSISQVVSTIGVGTNPSSVAYDSENGDLYVVNENSPSVSVINGETNQVATTIPFSPGDDPQEVAYDSGSGNLYTTDHGSRTVNVISGITNHIVKNISVGINPQFAAYDTGNGNIYVANSNCPPSCSGWGSVSVINGSTNQVVANITVGSNPYGVAYDSDNGDIYVTNSNAGNVSVISGSTNRVVSNFGTGGGDPEGVAYDGNNGDVYVTNPDAATVSIITMGSKPQNGGSPGPLGLPGYEGYILIGAAVVVVASAVVLLAIRKRGKNGGKIDSTSGSPQPMNPQPSASQSSPPRTQSFETTTCPSCRASVESSWNYCPSCTAKLNR